MGTALQGSLGGTRMQKQRRCGPFLSSRTSRQPCCPNTSAQGTPMWENTVVIPLGQPPPPPRGSPVVTNGVRPPPMVPFLPLSGDNAISFEHQECEEERIQSVKLGPSRLHRPAKLPPPGVNHLQGQVRCVLSLECSLPIPPLWLIFRASAESRLWEPRTGSQGDLCSLTW